MLQIVPISFAEACAFIVEHHRHHRPPRGMKLCLAVAQDGDICGVVTVGRPVARNLNDGWTLEVNRVATDGTKNACSMLYAAAWRAVKALGYRRLVTYTLPHEGGASLRAANWKLIGITTGGGGAVRADLAWICIHCKKN